MCSPRGDVVALPADSTPVDFAYAVHTEVGHRCVGAKVNGKLVPLESVLDNGDVVEIFTAKSDSAGPSQDWLRFVVSNRAKSKIRAWYSRERREEAVTKGAKRLSARCAATRCRWRPRSTARAGGHRRGSAL